MSTLVHLPQNTADAIKAIMPQLRECKVHPGEFTRDDIARFRKYAPAVHVAMPTLSDPVISGQSVRVNVRMVVLLTADRVVVDGKKMPVGASAIFMTAAIVQALPKMLLGHGVGKAHNITAKDFTKVDDSRHGNSVWVITWDIPVVEEIENVDGVLPEALYLGVVPEVGLDHVDDYTQILPRAEEGG